MSNGGDSNNSSSGNRNGNIVLLLTTPSAPIHTVLHSSFSNLEEVEGGGGFRTAVCTRYYSAELFLTADETHAADAKGCVIVFTAESGSDFESVKERLARLQSFHGFAPDVMVAVAWGPCSEAQKDRQFSWALDNSIEIIHHNDEVQAGSQTSTGRSVDEDGELADPEQPFHVRIKSCLECNVWPDMRRAVQSATRLATEEVVPPNRESETGQEVAENDSAKDAVSESDLDRVQSQAGAGAGAGAGATTSAVPKEHAVRAAMPASLFTNQFQEIAQEMDGDDAFSNLLQQMMFLRNRGHELSDDARRSRAAEVALHMAKLMNVDFSESDDEEEHENES
eukprot:ANDGO_03943.mRNA.1 hypothetical protein